MDPLNHVVTHVHRIQVGRHDFDAESIFVSGSLERLVPPACAFYQSRTHRLRRSASDVVDNRFHGFTNCCLGVLLLQTMTLDVSPGDRLANRRGEIHVLDSKITGPRIVYARLKTRRWQLDERHTLANGNGLRGGGGGNETNNRVDHRPQWGG